MNLNELKDRAYKTAKSHGWHDKELSDETYLMLIITEIAEAVQADRKDKHADMAGFKEYQTYYGGFLPSKEALDIRFRVDFEAYIKNSVEDELADVFIRCLDLAGLHSIDLSDEMDLIDKLSEVKVKKETDGTFVELMFEIAKIIFLEDVELNIKVNAVLLCVVELCRAKIIDIEWYVAQKMKYNELRGYKHGGKKY